MCRQISKVNQYFQIPIFGGIFNLIPIATKKWEGTKNIWTHPISTLLVFLNAHFKIEINTIEKGPKEREACFQGFKVFIDPQSLYLNVNGKKASITELKGKNDFLE